MSSIAVERIYERAASRDGIRILVDRLWPNGVGKGTAGPLVERCRPGPRNADLVRTRKDRFAEFEKRYLLKLRSNPADPGSRWPGGKRKVSPLLRCERRRQQSRRGAGRIT
jgi:uncharacterized protein YeaO (DUF488 family)